MAHGTAKALLVSLERNQAPDLKKDEAENLPSAPKGIRKGALDDIAALYSIGSGPSSPTPRPGVVRTTSGSTPIRTSKGSEHPYPGDVSARFVLLLDRTDLFAAGPAQRHTQRRVRRHSRPLLYR